MLQEDVRSSDSLGDMEVKELNIELKSGVLWNDWRMAFSSISILWRADEGCLLSLGKLDNSFVPSSDDLADTNLELEWSSLLD